MLTGTKDKRRKRPPATPLMPAAPPQQDQAPAPQPGTPIQRRPATPAMPATPQSPSGLVNRAATGARSAFNSIPLTPQVAPQAQAAPASPRPPAVPANVTQLQQQGGAVPTRAPLVPGDSQTMQDVRSTRMRGAIGRDMAQNGDKYLPGTRSTTGGVAGVTGGPMYRTPDDYTRPATPAMPRAGRATPSIGDGGVPLTPADAANALVAQQKLDQTDSTLTPGQQAEHNRDRAAELRQESTLQRRDNALADAQQADTRERARQAQAERRAPLMPMQPGQTAQPKTVMAPQAAAGAGEPVVIKGKRSQYEMPSWSVAPQKGERFDRLDDRDQDRVSQQFYRAAQRVYEPKVWNGMSAFEQHQVAREFAEDYGGWDLGYLDRPQALPQQLSTMQVGQVYVGPNGRPARFKGLIENPDYVETPTDGEKPKQYIHDFETLY